MPTNFEQARDIIDRRRKDNEAAAEQRKRELEAVSPDLKALNDEISSAGLRAFQAISLGKDAKTYLAKLAEENLDAQKKRKQILADMGLPEDVLDVQYTCPKCEDRGIKDGYYCDCFKALVRQLQFDNLNTIAPAETSSFDNFKLDYYRGILESDGTSAYDQMSQILTYCRSWANDFDRKSPSILLYGRTGLGKTHLSLAMANAVIAKGYNVVYGSAQNLLTQLEKEHFGRLKDDTSPEEMMLSADLLIIDDLGAEFVTQFTVAAIYNILNTRILRGLPTIISTNLMYDEIGDKYSERVYSRIIGNFTPLEFLGHDVRQLKS